MSTRNLVPISSKKGRRLALIVGVNKAPRSGLPPLQYADKDAEAIANALQQYGNFELPLPPLLNEAATTGNVRKAILDLIKDRTNGGDRTDDDFLLFYFSGHGYQTIIEAQMSAAYLVTADFDTGHVKDDNASHLSMHWLRDTLFMKTKAGRVLIILDCCYAEDVRTPRDHYLEELRQRINYYFEVPGREIEMPRGGLRSVLAASRYNESAYERDGHGEMTRLLLKALNGTKVDLDLLDDNGQVELYRLYGYLGKEMPSKQCTVVMVSQPESRPCILAWHSERIEELRRRRREIKQPDSYIGAAIDSTFQERPHEFEELEKLLFPVGSDAPPCIGLVGIGVVGMGGQGKTRLALEVAHRYEKRFLDGVYWMTATGTNEDKWVEHFAELAFNTNYLPADDNRASEKENKRNRACHICRYLASHDKALLILDNVEEPNLISSVITKLGGQEPQCTILYTSRYSFPPRSIPGVALHPVEKLPKTAAIALLLEKRKTSEGSDGEMDAARNICRYVDHLPLALMLLRSLLEDPYETVPKLEQRLKKRGAIETTRNESNGRSPLFRAFELSWNKLQSEAARRVLKLASCFPEAASIPLWLLGFAARLGENSDELDRAYRQLRQWSLVEPHSETVVHLHPVIREFAHLLIEYDRDGEGLLTEVRQRLLTEFTDLNKLENRARRVGYWRCLDMVHAASVLAKALQMDQEIDRVERWMTREGSLLGDERLWPRMTPELFYQQLYNRSLENGHLLTGDTPPDRWLRQDGRVGAEDPFLLQSLTGHESDINCIAFSHDGERVVVGLNNWAGTVRVWSATDGRLLSVWEEHHGAVIEVMFLPDNNNVVIGTATGMVYTWDIQQNKLKRELLPAEGRNVTHMAFASSSTGVKMVADTAGKIVRVRSVESGRTVATFPGHGRDVTCVAFSPDGSRLVTGSSDRFVCVWDVSTGQMIKRLEEHDQGVTSVAFSSDGRSIVTGADDSIARVWDVASGQCISMLEGHEKPIKIVTFSPDGTRIAAGSTNGIVLLWDIASGKILQPLYGHTDRLISMAFSPDGTKLATGARDRTVRIWNASGVDKVDIKVEACCELTCVAFSSDGSRLVTASNNEAVHIWDVAKRQVLSSLSKPIVSIKHVAFSPDSDSTRVATDLSEGKVCIWDCDKQKILNGHTGDITSLMFSPDGTMLATASTDATARLWDLASGRAVVLEGHLSEVTSVAFSPNGNEVVTGSKDGTARIWNVASQSTPILLKDRFYDVTSVCVSHDGTKVVTGSSDGTVRVWQWGEIKPLALLKKGNSEITALCFSPDDRLLIMGNKDGEIALWRVDQQKYEHPIGVYNTAYGVGAIHWQNPQTLVLADMGGPRHRPHLYHLMLEGTW